MAAAADHAAAEVESRECAQCGGHHKELQVCSGCMVTKYCGTMCQNAHWKDHKRECKRVQQERQAVGAHDAGS
jgi:hypothetical protein